MVSVREELAAIDSDIKQAMEDYQKPDGLSVDEVSAKINELYNKKKELSERAARETRSAHGIHDISDSMKSLLRDVSTSWGDWDVKHRRYVLRQLLDRVEIDGDNVSCVWSFF